MTYARRRPNLEWGPEITTYPDDKIDTTIMCQSGGLSPGICGTTPARGGVEGGSLDITSELTDSTCECGLGLT